MPLSARQFLNPACGVKPSWAVFDAAWYLHNYATAQNACGDDQHAARAFYLETGALSGHSPNPLFNETFYLAQNPDIATLVSEGAYASGFDHFCQYGHRELSPHCLFNDALYAKLYDDMSLENLDQHQFYGRYDHYLKSGQFESRIGHFLFDPVFYRVAAISAGCQPGDIDAAGPFVHYLQSLHAAPAEPAPSIYFDPAWYLQNSPGAKASIDRGDHNSAIEHYLCSDPAEARDPVPQFSEAFYRRNHADVGAAIEQGLFRNGYEHFWHYGAYELRQPHPQIDLATYRDRNAAVRDALNTGTARDAFAHLRQIGCRQGLAFTPPSEKVISETSTKQMFLNKARHNLALFSRRKLDFSCVHPVLSVIMVLFNKFELTMLALTSLRDNYAGEIELILVDNASSGDTARIAQYVTGATLLCSHENAGFLRAANLALPHAKANAVLYLNNDIELGHGAIAAALARLHAAKNIGAVGGKIIRSHGKLQEAGCFIWKNGHTSGYLRDAAPLAPEANFTRDVDFCSAVFLLCRADLLKRLGGFDAAFSPAYYEDADLCIRIAEAGYRIVYDPMVVVHHLEFGSATNPEMAAAQMRRGLKIFCRKHEKFLKAKHAPHHNAGIFARATANRQRILFLEDTTPLRRLGSGFVRANDIVHALAKAGYDVTVFPVNGAPYDIMSLFGEFPDTVEIMHDRDINGLGEFLNERRDYYNLVWISRTHNLSRVLPIFDAAGLSPETIPFVLDTEAVATIRDAAKAARGGITDFNADEALRVEFANASRCRRILAVNQVEAVLLESIAMPNVSVLGTMRTPDLTPNDFAARSGLLFVAAIHQTDSPNLDALRWYESEILPALAALMQNPPVLTVAGYVAPEVNFSAFPRHKYIKLQGEVDDLRPLYNANRVFIAPTRYAAGTPYKIYEAASFGVPCVTTTLLADQLGWASHTDLLTATTRDSAGFAAQIAKLYHNEILWRTLRLNAASRLTAENTESGFNATIAALLEATLSGRQAAPGKAARPGMR